MFRRFKGHVRVLPMAYPDKIQKQPSQNKPLRGPRSFHLIQRITFRVPTK